MEKPFILGLRIQMLQAEKGRIDMEGTGKTSRPQSEADIRSELFQIVRVYRIRVR